MGRPSAISAAKGRFWKVGSLSFKSNRLTNTVALLVARRGGLPPAEREQSLRVNASSHSQPSPPNKALTPCADTSAGLGLPLAASTCPYHPLCCSLAAGVQGRPTAAAHAAEKEKQHRSVLISVFLEG